MQLVEKNNALYSIIKDLWLNIRAQCVHEYLKSVSLYFLHTEQIIKHRESVLIFAYTDEGGRDPAHCI